MELSKFRKRFDNHGSVFLTMVFIFALVAIAVPFITVVLIELSISKNQSARIQAFYLADAGIAYGNDLLRQTGGGSSGTGGTPVYLTSSQGTVGSFTVTITNIGSNQWRVVSIGTPIDTYSQASILAITQKAPFTTYQIFRDEMTVPFGSGYHANGKVYVNGGDILTQDNPQFDKQAATIGVEQHSGSSPAQYLGGLLTHANVLDAPTIDAVTSVYSYASTHFGDGGLTDVNFTHGTTYNVASVTFLTSTARVVLTKSGNTTYSFLFSLSTCSVLAFRMPTYVSGTVNGIITLACMSVLQITGNLQYFNESQASDDLIGLMSNYWVEFAQNVPNNFYLDAAIFAPDSSRNPGGRVDGGPALNSAHASFNFLGSMQTHTNGSFVSGSNGFSVRNITYDNRLNFITPPFFGYTDIFHSVYWKNAYFL